MKREQSRMRGFFLKLWIIVFGISAFWNLWIPSPHCSAAEPGTQETFVCGTVAWPRNSRNARNLQVQAAPSIGGIGEKRLLLYRVDFSDATGAAISSNSAAALLTDLNSYYREMSYNLMSIAPAGAGSMITEVLRLPEASTAYDNNFTKLYDEKRGGGGMRGEAGGT